MTVAEARRQSHAQPFYTLDIALLNSGPVLHLSDRNVEVGGTFYVRRLDDLSGIAAELDRASSERINPNIILKVSNEPINDSHNHLIELGDTYPFIGAEVTISEGYMVEGVPTSDLDVLFVGVLDQPTDIDEMGFTCKVSDKLSLLDERWVQPIINLTDYPYADPRDVEKYSPMVVGTVENVPCRCIRAPGRSTLVADMTATSPGSGGTFDISGDVSDAAFPTGTAFTVYIDGEEIRCSSRSGNTFTVATGGRGYNSTTATSHNKGASVREKRSDIKYLVMAGVSKALNDVKVKVRGEMIRVISGVTKDTDDSGISTLVFSDGFKLEKNVDLGIDTGSHTHATQGASKVTPDGDSENTKSNMTTSGTRSNIRDGSDTTYYNAGTTDSATPSTLNIVASLPAWTGGNITQVYAVITHQTSGTGFDANTYAKVHGQSAVELDHSGTKVTQRLPIGSTYPSTFYIELKSNSGGGHSIAIDLYEMSIEVETDETAASAADGVALTAASRQTADVLADYEVYCDVDGYKDPDGNYGGSGNLVERPDWVFKYFLLQLASGVFASGEVDASSFSAAGTAYAAAITGGYKFGFAIVDKVKPSTILKEMAAEARSVIDYRGGKWYLDFLPDTAPSVDDTIDKADLADKDSKFVFNVSDRRDIGNDLTGAFKWDYASAGWLGTAALAQDSTSISKYGSYPKRYEFKYIRLQDMADDVLAFKLLLTKNPLLTVKFTVFWEKFDLKQSQTMDITSPLYNARKFYVEAVRRIDKARAEVVGREWW